MSIYKKTRLLIIFLLSFYSMVHGQFRSRISLEVTSVEYQNGNIEIRYNINNAKQKDKIRVWINIFDSKNDTIFAKNWSGDVDKFVNGGSQKLAVWNVRKDEIDIVDSIQVKISASIQNGLYLDNPFVLSTVFPGWGDYQIKPRRPYWIYGVLAYSFVGTSLYLHNSAANNYYVHYQQDADSWGDKDIYYNRAKKQNVLSYAFAGAAGLVWTLDYIGLVKRTRQIKKSWDKKFPVEETSNIPSFKIASSLSPKVFINTSLTNLELVKGSPTYVDRDEDHCIDAFEHGYITFKLVNKGPAKAVRFYAMINESSALGTISYPHRVDIESIPVHQTKLVKIPIKAAGNIATGSVDFRISVDAEHNNSVPDFDLKVKTAEFYYNKEIDPITLNSDVDKEIPVVGHTNPRKYALIIGNEGYANEFTGLSSTFNVPYARNDAIMFKQYAMDVLGVPEENIMLLLDVGKKEMRENILTISKQVSKQKDKAQLIFYYAGHGIADSITKAPYLVPVDVPPTEIKNAISLEFLYKKIWESRSSKSLVIIDASFNNGGRVIGVRGPSIKTINPRKEVISGNTVVFMAVSEKHTANSYPEKRHGLFTYYFLKTLKESKGNINLLELSNSLKSNVGAKAEELGFHQLPIVLVSIAVRDMWQEWKVR